MEINEADKVVHPVKDQWHYPIMTRAGYISLTKEAVGFVRAYIYERNGHQILVSTGCNADYWSDMTSHAWGYWSSLECHLRQLLIDEQNG